MRQTQHQGRTAYVLGEASDPESVASTPGIYVAPSSSPSYGVLRGLVLGGYATELGETQTEDGELAVAVEVRPRGGYAPNAVGSITIGADFFATAKDDYRNWKEKHVREAVQNSVDAGATRMRIDFQFFDEEMRPLPPESTNYAFVEVSYDDDGGGMDEDTLLNKFLVLGGSGKKAAPGSVGGFGKAKELLLLPWVRWSIETRTTRIEGHGIQYDVQTIPARRGTRLSCLMRGDDCTNEASAIGFVKKCYLPNVRFFINGKEYKANLKTGDLVASLAGRADVFYEKKNRLSEPAMLVRINGLYMHERYISSDITGTILVELTGRSTELLTANRDGIRQLDLSRALDDFHNRLAADTKSALKKSRNVVHKKYMGEKFKSEREQRELTDHIESEVLMTLGDIDIADLPKDKIEEVVSILVGAGGAADVGVGNDDDAPIDLRAPADAAAAMLDVSFRGAKHVIAATKLMAWQPAFYVVNETEDFHVPIKFMPERMAPGIRKLAKFWGEMCRFVLMQLGYEGEYGVGWIFDSDTLAAHLRESGEHWLLLNPFKASRLGRDVYSLSDKEDINFLYAAAVHEATHMNDGCSRHDESFAAALTVNMARTANRGAQINKIRQAVVSRVALPGKPARAAKAPKARVPEAMRDDAVSALLTEWGVMGDQSYLLERMKDAAEGDWFEAYSAFGTIFNSVSTLIRAFVAYDNETVVWGPLSPYSDPSLRDFVSSHRPCSIILSQIIYASEAHDRAPGPGLVFDGHRWYVIPSASEWLLERGA